jgi:hypothetical protein
MHLASPSLSIKDLQRLVDRPSLARQRRATPFASRAIDFAGC